MSDLASAPLVGKIYKVIISLKCLILEIAQKIIMYTQIATIKNRSDCQKPLRYSSQQLVR